MAVYRCFFIYASHCGVGALLAALLASFGDEALFLYSFDPLNALKLSFALFAIAVLFGFIVEYVPFINRTLKLHVNHVHTQSKCCSEEEHNNAVTQQQEWKRFVLIGCIIAFIIAVAYQVFEHVSFDLFLILTLMKVAAYQQNTYCFYLFQRLLYY